MRSLGGIQFTMNQGTFEMMNLSIKEGHGEVHKIWIPKRVDDYEQHHSARVEYARVQFYVIVPVLNTQLWSKKNNDHFRSLSL